MIRTGGEGLFCSACGKECIVCGKGTDEAACPEWKVRYVRFVGLPDWTAAMQFGSVSPLLAHLVEGAQRGQRLFYCQAGESDAAAFADKICNFLVKRA